MGKRRGASGVWLASRRDDPWIFLSYRREDTEGHAGRLYADLVDSFDKSRVFMDIDAIPPGSVFPRVIDEALKKCNVLLALIGRRWLAVANDQGRRLELPDDPVRLELEAGLRLGIRLIPVLVENAAMPARTELPATLAALADRHAFQLSNLRWPDDVRALIKEIRPRPVYTRRIVLAAVTSVSLIGVTLALPGTSSLLGLEPIDPSTSDVSPLAEARLSFPYGVGLDSDGGIYVADSGHLRVRRVDGSTIRTVAGTGEGGNSGDGGPAIEANTTCHGVAVSNDGAVYFASIENNNVRKIDPAGTISTLTGNGSRGYSGDGGPAIRAQLSGPWDIDVARDGTVFIADTGNNRIRRVDTLDRIDTVAGSGAAGFSGDGGPAVQAQLNGPRDVAVDPSGALTIADGENHRVRRVDETGRISTVAGTGTPGFGGDGGMATDAQLNNPHGVAIAADGSLYIGDLFNNRVRRVDRNGYISTVAGTGAHGFSGDGGPGVRAELAYPRAVAVDATGAVFIADINNNRIRKLDRHGIITTAVGIG